LTPICGVQVETPPSQDPTVRLYLGSYSGPRGGALSYERGTPVVFRAVHLARGNHLGKYGTLKGENRGRRNLSHTMHQFDGLRKSNPPQNRQIMVPISTSKQQVDDFVGESTF